MANVVPDASDLYFDDDARAYFEHLLPELAAQVWNYKASGPNSIAFTTGDYHHFIFTIRGEKTKDPLDLRWTLECVCWEKDDHQPFLTGWKMVAERPEQAIIFLDKEKS